MIDWKFSQTACRLGRFLVSSGYKGFFVGYD